MNSSYKIFLLAILLASFILRVNRLDYPLSYTFAWGDGTRDYLVASHIVRYHEFPKTGPYNLLDSSGVKSSPVYFYILALPLIIYNHPLTLAVVNLLLQMVSLVLIYLITKNQFNQKTAIISLILFSFNPEVIKFADYIWQPYLMLPLALLGVYLFIRGHPVLSMIAASLSFAIHNSALPWLAALLLLKFNLKSLVTVTLTLSVLYLPVILSSPSLNAFPAQTLGGYLNNLNSNLDIFLEAFYVNKLFLLVLIATILLYRYKPKTIFFIVLFCLPIAFASFFDKIRFHYLILSAPAFIVIVAYILDNVKPRILKLILFGLIFWIFSGHGQFIKDFKKPFENQTFVDEVIEKIISELPDQHSFQVKSYALDKYTFDYPVLDTILLVSLENKLKVKLAKVSDDSPFNHVQINKKDYLVLTCFKFQTPKDSDCREDFLVDFESYEIKKTIHTSEYVSVYLAY